LYERSGHWDKFKEELFKITTREGHLLAVKPMNCPHHTQIFARNQRSYREMPQRYASTTMQYRDEQTGELSGLSRVRSISIDDAHVFCRYAQIEREILSVWEIIDEFYRDFGFPLRVRLSLHDPAHREKYLGNAGIWKTAESILQKIARKKKVTVEKAIGEAAFYGPKVDFIAKDSLSRDWQVATVQLDMNQPERFDLSCINEGGKPERIVIIHAAIMGAIERFLAILIEHTAGAFPVWLAPVQISLVPVSDKFNSYANKLAEELRGRGLRVEIDERNESVGKKIREAEMQKAPYMLVVGEKEQSSGSLTVRKRGEKEQQNLKLEKFIEKILREIEEKK
jgi:threonyl-tRNA synthetase